MKIAVVSDTHLSDSIPLELRKALEGAEMVIHAGDFNTPVSYEAFRSASKKLIAVHGNSDAQSLKDSLPESAIVEVEGVKIGVIHKGKNVTDLTNMRYLALEMGVDVLIFGHLHRPLIEKSDVLLVCPGSPTQPRMSDPALVMLEVAGDNVGGSIVLLKSGPRCGYIEFMRSLES